MTLKTGRIVTDLLEQLQGGFLNLGIDNISYTKRPEKRWRSFSSYIFDKSLSIWKKKDSIESKFNHQMDFHTVRASRSLEKVTLSEHQVSRLLDSVSVITGVDLKQFYVGLNLVRVEVDGNTSGFPAPDFHQDGYDASCHINIQRMNVRGGESKVSLDREGKNIIVSTTLVPGDFILFDDRKYFHTATKVDALNSNEAGHRDMIIIDLVKIN